MLEMNILANLADEKNIVFMVDATYVYNPAIDKILSFLRNTEIEKLKSVRFLRFGDVLRMHHINRLKNTMFSNRVDIIKDLIFHDISILIYLFGDNIEIEDIKKINNLNRDLSDSVFIFLRIRDIPTVIEYSWIYPRRQREFQFYYDDRYLIFDDLNQDEKIWEFTYEDKKIRSISYDNHEPLFCVVDHFISCIKNGTSPKTGVDFMRKAMEVMDKICSFK